MHARYIQNVRRVSKRLRTQVAILMDLPGPKHRMGRLKGAQAVLKKGSQVTLTTRNIEGDATLVPVNLPNLPHIVKVGDIILLDDGVMQLRVLGKDDDAVRCRIAVGSMLTERRVSKYCPQVPILAITPSDVVSNVLVEIR